jgi:hypothetical protein
VGRIFAPLRSKLGVPTTDLRKLALVNQDLLNAAYEAEEIGLDRAEAVIDEALQSEDSRRRDAAATFILRNMARSKRRGWIPAAGANLDVNVNTNTNSKIEYTFRWRTAEDEERDVEERAQRGQTIEHESAPLAPSDKPA